jgi:hypothetical protein
MCIWYTKVNVYFVRKVKTDMPMPKNPAKNPMQQKPAKKPIKSRQKTDKSPKTFRMNTELLRQKFAELIIELTDADLGEVSNIYEAIDTIIAEVTE